MALEGRSVILREQRREDMPFMQDLRNDMETQAWSKSLPPDFTEVMYAKRFEEREFSYDPDFARFTIEQKETGERVAISATPAWNAAGLRRPASSSPKSSGGRAWHSMPRRSC